MAVTKRSAGSRKKEPLPATTASSRKPRSIEKNQYSSHSTQLAPRKKIAGDLHNEHNYAEQAVEDFALAEIIGLGAFTDILKDIGILVRKARTRITEPFSTRMKLYQDLTQDDATPRENASRAPRSHTVHEGI